MLQFFLFFFFNDTATTEIYTLSLHDALPICAAGASRLPAFPLFKALKQPAWQRRSEEHTSQLQSHVKLVCRPLLQKKNILQATDMNDTYRTLYDNVKKGVNIS